MIEGRAYIRPLHQFAPYHTVPARKDDTGKLTYAKKALCGARILPGFVTATGGEPTHQCGKCRVAHQRVRKAAYKSAGALRKKLWQLARKAMA